MGWKMIFGMVDAKMAQGAAAVLDKYGVTAEDVIRAVWHEIAVTGELPRGVMNGVVRRGDALRHLDDLREELAPDSFLATMTDRQMQDFIVEGLEEKYGPF